MADKIRKNHRLGKIFKRALALFIIVIINFNSYSAVVSSNDGSAFITKAEFDALVNDFNSRIEDYEKSIDAKIDGAIAEYLAGLATSRIDILNIIYSDWSDGVYNLNGDLNPTFLFPSIDLYYNLGQDYRTGDNIYHKMWWAWLSMKYNQTSSGTQYRPLVTNVTEYPKNIDNPVWNGRAIKWTEFIRGTRGDEQNRLDPAIWADGIQAGRMPVVRLQSMCNFGSNGYYANASSVQWNPKIIWYNSREDVDYSGSVTNIAFQYSHEINMEEYNGNTTDYNHIISWGDDDDWSVWNVNWSKTIGVARDNTLTRKDLFDAATKAGHTSGTEFAANEPRSANNFVEITSGTKTYFGQRINSDASETSTDTLVTTGLVSDNLKPTEIKQAMKRTITYAGKSYDLFLNLCQGFPVCAANKEEKIIWKPVFSEISCDASASSNITTNGRINILLATQPFGPKGTVDNQYIIKTKQMKEGTITTNYSTTPNNSLTMELEFEMPVDGIVYAIWWPTCTNDTYLNDKTWQIKLDIPQCSTYERESIS